MNLNQFSAIATNISEIFRVSLKTKYAYTIWYIPNDTIISYSVCYMLLSMWKTYINFIIFSAVLNTLKYTNMKFRPYAYYIIICIRNPAHRLFLLQFFSELCDT